jgi:hypothetical protein
VLCRWFLCDSLGLHSNISVAVNANNLESLEVASYTSSLRPRVLVA